MPLQSACFWNQRAASRPTMHAEISQHPTGMRRPSALTEPCVILVMPAHHWDVADGSIACHSGVHAMLGSSSEVCLARRCSNLQQKAACLMQRSPLISAQRECRPRPCLCDSGQELRTLWKSALIHPSPSRSASTQSSRPGNLNCSGC